MQKIIHVDMDAFYASIEQRDFREYRGKPLIVGGLPNSRGVVATCSYEARKCGIHSAMPAATAYRLCPQAIFVKPRFDVYKQVSQNIQQIFREYSDIVEPLSLDEAYLDVSNALLFRGSASSIAMDIKNKIYLQTKLIASAGVSYNKFLAKIASDQNKPDGLFVITPQQGPAFVNDLPIGKFFGVGKVTEAKMHSLSIYSGGDLKNLSLQQLHAFFGKAASYYYQLARGIDNRPVQSHRKRRSLSKEITFISDIINASIIKEKLNDIAIALAENMQKKKIIGSTLTLKVKYDNFELTTRSITFTRPITHQTHIIDNIPGLLSKTEVGRRKIRLLGLCISNLNPQNNKTTWHHPDMFDQ